MSRALLEVWQDHANAMAAQCERLMARADAERDEARARYREAMEHNRALVQQIVELRKDGFSPPMAYPSPDAPASLPAKVEAALKKAEAGLPRDVKVAMREKASALLAAEKTPDDVVEIITRGLQVVA